MLYVMLCGRLPFDDEYIPLLFKKISGRYTILYYSFYDFEIVIYILTNMLINLYIYK